MTQNIGPTGDYPRGKLNPDDEGGLRIGVTHDDRGHVVINFGAKVKWIAMPPENAIQFAKIIMRHAGVKKLTVEL